MTTTLERPAVGQAVILRRARMDRVDATIIGAVARLPSPPSLRELSEIADRSFSVINTRIHYREHNLVAEGWLVLGPRGCRALGLGPRFAGLDNRDNWPLELVKA